MLDPQGDLSHRDENHSLDYSLYIPSHSTHASPEHERKAENSLIPPLTAASSTRSRMEGHGTPVSGLRSIGLGSASRQHGSHVERTEASSRPQSSNPMHQIDIGRLTLLGTSSMVVSPRPLKLADYRVVGPALGAVSAEKKVDQAVGHIDSQERQEDECNSGSGATEVSASRSDAEQKKRDDARKQSKTLNLKIDIAALSTPADAACPVSVTTSSKTTAVSRMSPESAQRRPSVMLEMLHSSSIVKSKECGSMTRERLAPATDYHSSPESPRQRLLRRRNSPDSPRRSPIAHRGKRPPLLLPGSEAGLGNYFGGPIKKFGASRTASAEKRQVEEEDSFVIKVQHEVTRGSEQTSDGGHAALEVPSAKDGGFHRRTRENVDTEGLDLIRTASDHTIPSVGEIDFVESSSPLDSPARFGGRYSPRDGRALGLAFTESGDAFERTLSAARSTSNDSIKRASHQSSKVLETSAGTSRATTHASIEPAVECLDDDRSEGNSTVLANGEGVGKEEEEKAEDVVEETCVIAQEDANSKHAEEVQKDVAVFENATENAEPT